MARNTTTVTSYAAEFRSLAFAANSGAWTATRFDGQVYEPYAVSTLGRDLITDGWRELSEYDVKRSFPRGKAFADAPIEKVFVNSAPGSLMGTMVVLTKGKW